MNIVIVILSIINIILIYVNDYLNSMLRGEIIFDIIGGVFSYFVYYFFYAKNEKIIKYLKYLFLGVSIFILLILIFCFINRSFNDLSNKLSVYIPMILGYFGILVRKKLEDKYII